MMNVTFESKLPGDSEWIPVKSPSHSTDHLALAWLEGYLGVSTFGGGVITIRNFKVIREG